MKALKRPMKAPTEVLTDEQLEQLKYPIVGSPKLDGFRCTVNGDAFTSSMKLFQNHFIHSELRNPIYNGLDGEVIVGDPTDPNAFHNTSGPVRRLYGEPDFRFYVFDDFTNLDIPYKDRWLNKLPKDQERLIVLKQRLLKSPQDVIVYEKEMLAIGYEGAMIRSLDGRYKEGRCTFKEQNIFKRKPFIEVESIIVGLEEGMINDNEKVINEMGLSKRSHDRSNMFPSGTLGAFILKSDLWTDPFKAAPGKGYTAELRQQIWDNILLFIGQIATVKYQKYGSRNAPRLPSVIKIRTKEDFE